MIRKSASGRTLLALAYDGDTPPFSVGSAGHSDRGYHLQADASASGCRCRHRDTGSPPAAPPTIFQYDHAGNLLADDKARYSYDAFNRTEKVETFNGHIQLNRYDAEGLRYEMEETSLTIWVVDPISSEA